MHSCISRRIRWWDTLRQLDPATVISENIRAELLLNMSRLTPDQRLMIKTSVGNKQDFDAIALAMVRQHPKIHFRERKSAPESGRKPQRFQSRGDNQRFQPRGNSQHRKPFHKPFRKAHLADEDGDADEVSEVSDESDMQANLAEDYPEEADETNESIEDSIVVAYLAQGVDVDAKIDLVADTAQSEVIAFMARDRARGKGFPMPKRNFKFSGNRMKTNMTLEDRKANLVELGSQINMQEVQ